MYNETKTGVLMGVILVGLALTIAGIVTTIL